MKRATRRRKPDFGVLLTSFGRRTKPKPAQGNRAEIRLPSLERLLEIDAESELAAREAREKAAASRNGLAARVLHRRR